MKTQLVLSLYMLFLLNHFAFSQSIINVYQTNNSQLVYDIINDLTIDENGNLFIATEFGLSMLSANNSWTNWNYPTDNLLEDIVRSIHSDTNNGIYLGGFLSGLSFYDGNLFENLYFPVELDNFIRDIESDETHLYLATANGIGILNKLENVWSFINNQNTKIPSSNISCLALHGNGKLYAGTINGGLLIIEQNSVISLFGESDGLPDNTISDIAIDNAGEIWMTTPAAGLVFYDGINFENINALNSNLASNNLSSIAISQNDEIWIGSENEGLIFLNDEGFTTLNTSNSTLPSNQINKIEIVDSNLVWVGTNNGLVKINTGLQTSLNTIETNIFQFCTYNYFQKSITIKNKQTCNFVSIYDLTGKRINVNFNENETIDVGHYSNGHYVICCQTANNYVCQRIFLSH